MPNAYPIAADLTNFLTAANIATAALASFLDPSLLDAIRAFEEATGRKMLAAAGTREFDPPTNGNGVLDLQADLVAVTSLTYDGKALAASTDYRLMPANALDDGRPYTMIRFKRRWSAPLPWSLQNSIVIVGSWGYGTTVPDDVWLAILAGAAWRLYPQIAKGETGGLVSWTRAETTENYGADPLGRLRDVWGGADGMGGQFGEVVRKYKRVAAGL